MCINVHQYASILMFYMYDLDDLFFLLDQGQLYETNTLLVSVHSQSYNQPHHIWRRG